MFWLFALAVIIFVCYALWTQFSATAPTDSTPKRIVTAIGFALAALASGIAAWFHSTPTP
jgi:protein-S-isoprenylcysteine O-methyltransferase Ste14